MTMKRALIALLAAAALAGCSTSGGTGTDPSPNPTANSVADAKGEYEILVEPPMKVFYDDMKEMGTTDPNLTDPANIARLDQEATEAEDALAGIVGLPPIVGDSLADALALIHQALAAARDGDDAGSTALFNEAGKDFRRMPRPGESWPGEN